MRIPAVGSRWLLEPFSLGDSSQRGFLDVAESPGDAGVEYGVSRASCSHVLLTPVGQFCSSCTHGLFAASPADGTGQLNLQLCFGLSLRQVFSWVCLWHGVGQTKGEERDEPGEQCLAVRSAPKRDGGIHPLNPNAW